uniref:Outer envelope pore protein 16-4, chloroplastic n=1 Tax=Glycine max TaxID=3847 RepID=A0A0R0HZU1_SOYBN
MFLSNCTSHDRERKMEEDLDGVAPCSSLAVEAMIRVGAAGAIWGLCAGPYDARQQGLRGSAKASFVVNGLIGGAVAGAAAAAAAGTRSWSQVIGMAGLVSVFCAAADYSRTS